MFNLIRTYRRSLLAMTLAPLATAAALAATPVTQISPAASGPVVFANTATGGGTSTQSIQLQFSVNGTVAFAIPASGNAHQQFVVGTVSGCTADGTTVNSAPFTCTVPVIFQPYYPGQATEPLTVTLNGQVYSFGLTGLGTGPLLRIDPTYISTTIGAAGTTTSTASPDGVAIASGIIDSPEGLFADNSNNIYIADTGHDRLRVAYQTLNAQLACLIITENPTSFGLTAGANTCAGATSQPIVGDVYTLAGENEVATYANGNGVLATSTPVNVTGVVADAFGNLFIADAGNNRVRVVYQGGANIACLIITENPTLFGSPSSCSAATTQPTQGFIYTLAGTGTFGFSGDSALATSANLYTPQAIAVDTAGDVFVTEYSTASPPSNGGRVRVIYNGGTAAAQLITVENPSVTTPVVGDIYTVAGSATITEGGDGGLATSAGMLTLYDIKLDAYDNIYVPDKTYGSTTLPLAVNRLRVIYNGTAASPNPLANLIALENSGTTAQPGYIYTIAGSTGVTASTTAIGDGGLASAAHFAGIYGVGLDPAGDLIVPDRLNYTVRRISAATGLISTIAGAPAATQNILSGSAQPGQGIFWGPWAISVNSSGGFYVTDNGANRVRAVASVSSSIYPLVLPATSTSTTSGLIPIVATNIGTPGSTLTISSDFATAFFGFLSPAGAPGISDCATASTYTNAPTITSAAPVSLTSGNGCSFGIAAQPGNAGTTTGNVAVYSNTENTPGSGLLQYTSVTATGVQTVLSASPSPITGGNPTVLTATLTNGTTPVTSGTVTFSITNGASLGSATLDPVAGTASITTSLLTAPTTSITTMYPGATGINPLFTASTSITVLTVSAKPATTLTLTTSNAAPNLGQSITLTATVASAASTSPFTGNVTFSDTFNGSTTTLATPITVTNGVATLILSTLAAGTHKISAAYANDLVYANATSSTVTVTVTAPGFSATAANTAGLVIQPGKPAAIGINVVSVGGYSGTVTASCPANQPGGISCSFSPGTSLIFTGNNSTQTLTVVFNTTLFSRNDLPSHHSRPTMLAMLLGFPATLLGLVGLRRRKRLQSWQQIALLALILCASLTSIAGLSGCTSNVSQYGTFSVPVTLTDGVNPTTIPITVSVLGPNTD